MILLCTAIKNDRLVAKYDVPLYGQGLSSLCWAYSEIMIKAHHNGTDYKQKLATAKALSMGFRRSQSENDHRLFASLRSRKIEHRYISKRKINGIEGLYDLLRDHGPIMGSYSKSNDNSGHVVVITGVDVNAGLVYTNDSSLRGVKGVQSYEDFENGFASYSFNSYYFDGVFIVD